MLQKCFLLTETGTVPSNDYNDSSHNDDDSDKAYSDAGGDIPPGSFACRWVDQLCNIREVLRYASRGLVSDILGIETVLEGP